MAQEDDGIGHGTSKVIALGVAAFLCAVILLAYAVNAFGQVRGTFVYIPPDSLIDLFKTIIFALSGIGTAGLVVSSLVAFRAVADKKEPDDK